MSDYIKAMEVNNEPHAEGDDHPMNICPSCRASLFEVGITEGIAGGYSETEIRFVNGKAKTGITSIQNFDEQWALCGKCDERVEHLASEIIEAFERLHPPEPARSLNHITGGQE